MASLLVEHGSRVQEHHYLWYVGLTVVELGISGILVGMWDLPKPGIESVSPAMAGRFLTAGPPRKSKKPFLNCTRGLLSRGNVPSD